MRFDFEVCIPEVFEYEIYSLDISLLLHPIYNTFVSFEWTICNLYLVSDTEWEVGRFETY